MGYMTVYSARIEKMDMLNRKYVTLEEARLYVVQEAIHDINFDDGNHCVP